MILREIRAKPDSTRFKDARPIGGEVVPIADSKQGSRAVPQVFQWGTITWKLRKKGPGSAPGFPFLNLNSPFSKLRNNWIWMSSIELRILYEIKSSREPFNAHLLAVDLEHFSPSLMAWERESQRLGWLLLTKQRRVKRSRYSKSSKVLSWSSLQIVRTTGESTKSKFSILSKCSIAPLSFF